MNVVSYISAACQGDFAFHPVDRVSFSGIVMGGFTTAELFQSRQNLMQLLIFSGYRSEGEKLLERVYLPIHFGGWVKMLLLK